MEKLTLPEIQQAELVILKKFHEICEENGLTYWLAYGTLLGAIRHKGFIPWDDDLDVVMPRNDYEKFIEIMKKNDNDVEGFYLAHYKTDKNYIYPIGRFCDSRYKVDYHNTKQYRLGIFIDIYPFDGCGNTKEQAIKIVAKARKRAVFIYLSGLISIKGEDFFKKARNKIFYPIARIKPYFLIKHSDKLAKKKKIEDNKYIYYSAWAGSDDAFETVDFKNKILVDFEGGKFYAPENYDKILRMIYGDYMQLPPEEKRVPHHDYEAFKI